MSRHLHRVTWLISSISVICSMGCATSSAPVFDGTRAYSDLIKQVAFGPRVPNTKPHVQCRDWMVSQLKPLADKLIVQSFRDRARGTDLSLHNVIAVFNPKASKRLMIAAHWDSRPVSDQAQTASDRMKPVPGANDGASGVAVLLELARCLKKKAPDTCIILAFWDGEDYGPNVNEMFLGSRYFVQDPRGFRPDRGILLDMIGDSDLQIPREQNSNISDGPTLDKLWSIAAKMGYEKQFPDRYGQAIEDDHIPFIEAGVPFVDLIDFDYPYWHTPADTPDKCSAKSLKAVGDVVLEYIYQYGKPEPQ